MKSLADFFVGEALLRDGVFAQLGHADSPIPLTLAYCDSTHYLGRVNENNNISCVVTSPTLAEHVVEAKGVVSVDNPRNVFYQLHVGMQPYRQQSLTPKIHPTAVVSPQAQLGAGVVVNENVVIRQDVKIGQNSFIDAGSIIGVDGLLYFSVEGRHIRVEHQGSVEIGSGVTILANSVVARGIHPRCKTRIDDGVTVGVATTIGHEATIKDNCVVSGNCVVARGAVVGERAWLGSNVVVKEYVEIGARSRVSAGSIVITDVPPGEHVSGNFAVSHKKRLLEFLRNKRGK